MASFAGNMNRNNKHQVKCSGGRFPSYRIVKYKTYSKITSEKSKCQGKVVYNTEYHV